MLGTNAVVPTRFLPMRIIYALRYKDGIEVFKDQTEELKTILSSSTSSSDYLNALPIAEFNPLNWLSHSTRSCFNLLTYALICPLE